MIRSCASYSDEQLWQLLQGDDQDHTDSANHLAECPHCQARLEQLAADAKQWSEIRDSLRPDQEFGTGSSLPSGNAPSRRPRSGRERWQRNHTWTESMAKSLLSSASHPEMLGRIGRYDVERLIGSGGMGVVFKAYDTELNRPVAVKLLAPYLAGSGSARNRFAREARAAAAVVDDHVVPIHNVETDGEHPFLVMKFIAGGSLQQRIDREGPLEVCEVLRIGMHTAKGLAAAHAQGLIHRDVKPSNILLDEGVDRALLTDFGLARATDDASLTRSGFHPGTPHYMSPEQVCGVAIDARSDLFGLGCVIYAMCTGHPPFRSETSYAVLRRITDDTPRPIRETNANVPEWLERIVMKLLAKSRDDRYTSAFEVHTLLEKCLAHVQQPTAVELPVELQLKAKSRKWLAALAIVPVCIALVCGVWWFNNRPTEIGDDIGNNAASAQTETASLAAESQLQWESDTDELESLRQDFAPIELKTKKLWDVEPAKNSFNDKP
jgi:serine/threonine protein kinase